MTIEQNEFHELSCDEPLPHTDDCNEFRWEDGVKIWVCEPRDPRVSWNEPGMDWTQRAVNEIGGGPWCQILQRAWFLRIAEDGE